MKSVKAAAELAWTECTKRDVLTSTNGFTMLLQDILAGAPGGRMEWTRKKACRFRVLLAEKFMTNATKACVKAGRKGRNALFQRVFIVHLVVRAACGNAFQYKHLSWRYFEDVCWDLIQKDYKKRKYLVEERLTTRVSVSPLSYPIAYVACKCYFSAMGSPWESFRFELWRYLYENNIVLSETPRE